MYFLAALPGFKEYPLCTGQHAVPLFETPLPRGELGRASQGAVGTACVPLSLSLFLISPNFIVGILLS